MTPEQILELIKSQQDRRKYVVGLRGLYNQERIGKLRKSYVWVDGNRTRQKLEGTSCLLISGDHTSDPDSLMLDNIRRSLKIVKSYGQGRVGLVMGTGLATGIVDDPREIVVIEAELVAIISH